MDTNPYSGRGGSVRTEQIPKLTNLEIANRISPELVISDPEIVERFKFRNESSSNDSQTDKKRLIH